MQIQRLEMTESRTLMWSYDHIILNRIVVDLYLKLVSRVHLSEENFESCLNIFVRGSHIFLGKIIENILVEKARKTGENVK